MNNFKGAPLNYPAIFVFSSSTLISLIGVPLYAWYGHLTIQAWIFYVLVTGAAGLSITGGYHRLWSHRAYEAHPLIQVWFALFGAMSLQNSILYWSSLHRAHHKSVDDVDEDPYSIKRGFWFAHMGWMLRHYPSGNTDYSNVKDLLDNRVVMFQHNHYAALAAFMNMVLPLVLGACFGDPLGFWLLGTALRLFVNHHTTFFVNSLSHTWGSQPFTASNTARDNGLVAFLTYGEGFHNYHHYFQKDYRNGVKWWDFDPTKWMIVAMHYLDLAQNLQKVSKIKIYRAMNIKMLHGIDGHLRGLQESSIITAPIITAPSMAGRESFLQDLQKKHETENHLLEKVHVSWQHLSLKMHSRYQGIMKSKKIRKLEKRMGVLLLRQQKRLKNLSSRLSDLRGDIKEGMRGMTEAAEVAQTSNRAM